MDSAILDFYLRIRLVGPWRFKKRQAPWESRRELPALIGECRGERKQEKPLDGGKPELR